MGILGELNMLAKAGQYDRANTLLEKDHMDQLIAAHVLADDAWSAAKQQRTQQHDYEIGLAAHL